MVDEQIGNRAVKPVPEPPHFGAFSPEVVCVLDEIRFHLQDSDEHAEFTWFAREYSRCYRYHLDCADFRLRTIAELYREILAELAPRGRVLHVGVSNKKVNMVYWDFESFLSEINIALDLLARIAGTAYEVEMSANFNKFCKKEGNAGPLGLMKKAQLRWVNKLKDYRDCFVHYTPVDTLLIISLVQYADGFEIYGKLPVNPNVREILGFRFSRQVELFKYACAVHRHMTALDRAVAKEIDRAFARGEYPKRKANLFFVGRRERR
ncbi:MAG: hypothetical protein HY669_02630 [Chloroflexi bacterium]|nr:hypothetical protein [Chloroflexota bacterium]